MKKSYKSLSIICENLSSLYKDGIDISMAVTLLEDIPLDIKYKNSIKNIEYYLSKGETIKEAFSHYKELEKLGLAAPQVTYVIHALKEKGWDIDTDATTVEEAKEAILKALKLPLKKAVSEKTDPGKGAAL